MEEKRGITASVTCDMTGRVLPLQLIYSNKDRKQSLPAEELRKPIEQQDGWLFCRTASHWQTPAWDSFAQRKQSAQQESALHTNDIEQCTLTRLNERPTPTACQ